MSFYTLWWFYCTSRYIYILPSTMIKLHTFYARVAPFKLLHFIYMVEFILYTQSYKLFAIFFLSSFQDSSFQKRFTIYSYNTHTYNVRYGGGGLYTINIFTVTHWNMDLFVLCIWAFHMWRVYELCAQATI